MDEEKSAAVNTGESCSAQGRNGGAVSRPKVMSLLHFFHLSGAAAESMYSYTVLLPKSSSPSGGRSTKKSKGSRAQRTE